MSTYPKFIIDPELLKKATDDEIKDLKYKS